MADAFRARVSAINRRRRRHRYPARAQSNGAARASSDDHALLSRAAGGFRCARWQTSLRTFFADQPESSRASASALAARVRIARCGIQKTDRATRIAGRNPRRSPPRREERAGARRDRQGALRQWFSCSYRLRYSSSADLWRFLDSARRESLQALALAERLSVAQSD